MTLNKVNCRILHRVLQRLSSKNLKTSHTRHILKVRKKEINLLQLLGIAMIICYTKFYFSKCKCFKSFLRKNVTFKFYSLLLSFFFKVVILKNVHPLHTCQHTNFYDRSLTGLNFASTSRV
jgi:hypothetical protein